MSKRGANSKWRPILFPPLESFHFKYEESIEEPLKKYSSLEIVFAIVAIFGQHGLA